MTRAFEIRKMILRHVVDGSWRNSISYIGDPSAIDRKVCTYDYDRGEIQLRKDSPLAQPYPWAASCPDLDVDVRYCANGMASIVAFLMSVSGKAIEEKRPHVVLTHRHLYYETDMLLNMSKLHDVEIRRFDTAEELIHAANSLGKHASVFLDSCKPWGDVSTVSAIMHRVDRDRLGCVAWDNSLAPVTDHPFGPGLEPRDLPFPLMLLRSHVKLDQMGLELCSIGSLAFISSSADDGRSPGWKNAMRRHMLDTLTWTGACVSPTKLRLLAGLGLPNHELVERANDCLRKANALGRELLAARLEPTGRYPVEDNQHNCFVSIHIGELAAPPTPIELPFSWPAWHDLEAELLAIERSAAKRSIAVWKSVSFGYHYTALSWHECEDPPRPYGRAHTVLRVSFGMHDPEVTTAVADVVAEHLIAKTWMVPDGATKT